MTNNTQQENIEKFNEIIGRDINDLFDQKISKEDSDLLVLQEVGDMINEVVFMDNKGNELLLETKDSLDLLQGIKKSVDDIEKISRIKEDLANIV
ncbi:MAG: hypothetical protein WCO84_00140 [bacterium]